MPLVFALVWYTANADTMEKMTNPASTMIGAGRQRLLLVALAVLLVLACFSIWNGLESLRWGWRLDRGKALLTGHDPESAFPVLDRCARENSTSAEAAFLAGQSARMTDRRDSAKYWLDQARGRGWAEPAVELEQALLGVQAGVVFPYRIFAEKCLEVEQPDRPRILEALARHHFLGKEYPIARRYAAEWSEAEPGNPSAWVWLGRADLLLKDFPSASEAFSKALACDGSNSWAMAGLADSWRRQGRAEEALGMALKLKSIDPRRVSLDRLLGSCLADCGKFNEAIPALRKALASDPNDHEAAVELGRVLLLAKGDAGEARKVLEQSINRRPLDAEATGFLADALERLGERDKAAATRTRLGEIRGALKLVDQCMEEIGKNPKVIAPRLALAELYLKNGVRVESARWAESALVMEPNHERAREILLRARGEKP